MCEDSKWFALTSSLLSLHGTIPPSGTKKSRPAEHNVAKQTFCWWVCSTNSVTPIYTPWFLYLWIMGEKWHYIAQWLTAYSFFWRTLSQSCKVLPPSWHYNCLQKPILLFHQRSCFRMVRNPVRQINSLRVVQCCTSFAVKWIFWSESMLCWVPQWWIRHSLSPQMIVWLDSSLARSTVYRV